MTFENRFEIIIKYYLYPMKQTKSNKTKPTKKS